MLTLRLAPSTEFRGGSCRDSQIGWRPHICKVWPGCIKAHSKTPTHLHTLGWRLVWGWDVGGYGLGMGGGGGRSGWVARNVFSFPPIAVTFRYLQLCSAICRCFPLFDIIFRYLLIFSFMC